MAGKFYHQNPLDPRRYDEIEHTGYSGDGEPAGIGWCWLGPLIFSTLLFWIGGGKLWSLNHLYWSGVWVFLGLVLRSQWLANFWFNLFCYGLAASPVFACLWALGLFHWLIFAVTGIDLTR